MLRVAPQATAAPLDAVTHRACIGTACRVLSPTWERRWHTTGKLVKSVCEADLKKEAFYEQILGLLKESEAGVPVKDGCRKHGLSVAAFYVCRSNRRLPAASSCSGARYRAWSQGR